MRAGRDVADPGDFTSAASTDVDRGLRAGGGRGLVPAERSKSCAPPTSRDLGSSSDLWRRWPPPCACRFCILLRRRATGDSGSVGDPMVADIGYVSGCAETGFGEVADGKAGTSRSAATSSVPPPLDIPPAVGVRVYGLIAGFRAERCPARRK